VVFLLSFVPGLLDDQRTVLTNFFLKDFCPPNVTTMALSAKYSLDIKVALYVCLGNPAVLSFLLLPL
jgi:hypothetical protein